MLPTNGSNETGFCPKKKGDALIFPVDDVGAVPWEVSELVSNQIVIVGGVPTSNSRFNKYDCSAGTVSRTCSN